MKVNHRRIADRLRALQGEMKPAEFARKCGLRESLMRKYLAGSVPGADKLAKIALANHVSLDWLAAGRGPMRYEEKPQAHHEDFVRAGYLEDAIAEQRTNERVHSLMEPAREAFETLTRIAIELQIEIPPRWLSVLSVQLASRQISAIAARAILEALKAELSGRSP